MNSILKMIMFIALDVAAFPFSCTGNPNRPQYISGLRARFFYVDKDGLEQNYFLSSKDDETIELEDRVFKEDDQGNEILYYYLYDMNKPEDEQNIERVEFPYTVTDDTPTSSYHYYSNKYFSTVVHFKAFINVEINE